MGKNTVDKVITVATAEVGYLEKSATAYRKDPSCLDEKTRGAGSDNYTKYGRDMHKIYPAVMDFPAYWCDAFVDWCFQKAYGVANAKKLLGGNFDDYTVASCQLYKNKGALDTTPTKGAQVFFTRNGQVSGCHHTGIVYKVDKTYFYTIEGNTSGASGVVSNGGGVAKKKYSIAAYKGKTLFGHPKYDKATTTTTAANMSGTSGTTKAKTVTAKDSAKSFDKTLAGTYKVTASELNVRTGAGTSKKELVAIPKNTKVTCYGYYTTVSGTKWLYVQFTYKNVTYTGFCSSKYLKK